MENDGVSPTIVIIDDHSKRISDLEAKITELISLTTKPVPSTHSEKEKQRYYLKREEINAKRRAAYKAKRAALVTTGDS